MLFGPPAALAAVALAACATIAATQTVTPRLPLCDGQAACYCEPMALSSFKLFCTHAIRYTFRLTYVAASGSSGVSVIIWCDPIEMRSQHYEHLFSYNMTLGPVESVVFNLCPLPAGRLDAFFARFGIVGVKLVKINSHAILNDTMPADYLQGSNIADMQINDLSTIHTHSDFFATMTGLQKLTMTGSRLQLPGDIFRHTPGLSRLVLTGNQLWLDELPDSLFDGLTRLKMLSLGANRLHAVTRRHFRDLERLEMLDLYRNGIRTLPADAFASLRSLKRLSMQYNPLQALPETLFVGTPDLQLLQLSGGLKPGNLTTVPAGLFRGLASLELLKLNRLNVSTLPDGLFDGLTALANLTLSHNRLESLAESTFAGLTSLWKVDIGNNRMAAVPALLFRGLRNLDTVYLNDNRLTALPDDMFVDTQLRRLFLDDNNIANVSVRTFSGLGRTLHKLQLDGNRIELDDGVPFVTPAFQQLARLRVLGLSGNRIRFITQDLLSNLMQLVRLDLRRNRLQQLTFNDLNFLCDNAKIDMRFNNISRIAFPLATLKAADNGQRKPNTILINNNPLQCDCNMLSLKAYMQHTGQFAKRKQLDQLFLLKGDSLTCAQPQKLMGQSFASLSADQLLCLLEDDCPAGCVCQNQSSETTVLVTCARLPAGAPLPTRLPRVNDAYGVSLNLENIRLRRLTSLANTTARISHLRLGHNSLTDVDPAALPPRLAVLRLDHNRLEFVRPSLLAYFNTTGVQVTLGHNPYVCNCSLLPLYNFVHMVVGTGSRQVLDASDIFCAAQNSSLLALRSEQLCPGAATIVIALSVVVTAMAMCLLVSAVLYYNYSDTLKVWLYAHGWCLWWVSEEEMDSDKKYDAFISYSHLDEDFVVEQLVPHLERGEPQYSLCLHFRDWLAGEWITDQIQRSVQESRRVLVVLSQNFIQSEWGRLEFLAAHKQALNDKTNRVVLIVYGELPDPATMDPELRLYISMNTYLKWGDALFWERLRYALPHKGRRLKRRRRRRLTTDKLGLIIRDGGASSAGSTPTITPTTGELPAAPASNGHANVINGHANGHAGGPANSHVNGSFIGDKLATIGESKHREQCLADNVV